MINKIIRKILVTSMGITILFIGLLAIVLPGPAIIIIPLGIIILASEYYFIRKLLRPINKKMMKSICKSNNKNKLCHKLKKIQKILEKKN